MRGKGGRMRRRLFPIVLLLVVTGLGAAAVRGAADAPQLVVHEWGTFTSIAGEDGRAVDWLPLSGPPDLPCFVNQFGNAFKWQISGLVRMETPAVFLQSDECQPERRRPVPPGLHHRVVPAGECPAEGRKPGRSSAKGILE